MDGGTGGTLPSWARAAEPLVPSANIPAVVKEVRKALKEIQRASDEIARLSRKRTGREIGQQLLTLSTETRERARETSQAIRTAFASAEDGTADHATLTALSEEFKATLRRFQQEAELATGPSQVGALGASVATLHAHTVVDIQCGECDNGRETAPGRVAELQAVTLNDSVLAEREQGILSINRTVHEVAEIFQDLALLVNEQGSQIDNIQTNIEAAAVSTTRGVRELTRANRTQQRRRSRMCCLAVIIVIMVFLLLTVLHALPGVKM